ATDDGPTTRRELVSAHRRATAAGPKPSRAGRTVEELRSRIEGMEVELRRKAEEKQQRAAAADLDRRLKQIADRGEATVWAEVDEKMAAKNPCVYKEVVDTLTDLVLFARRADRETEAQARVDRLREAHAGKKAFIKQLGQAEREWGSGTGSVKVKK